MSYKNFLVHVDDRPRCKTRLEMAAGLAESFGASLTGLGIRYLPRIPQYVSAQIGPALEETQKKMLAEATEREKAVFDEVVEHFNIGHEFRVTQGDLIESFCQHARYTDVVVVGQRDDSEDFGDGEGGIVDHLILDVGRPVLVVPYSGTFQGIGKRVLVAWNGSREATRAVNDALPFLERAEKVEVVVINPTIGRYGHGDVPGADICQHLARHGVNAEAHAIHADRMDPGSVLLSRAADVDADLIVMGAYGRSRLRELVLGGATRHLVKHMTVPVLMSH